MKKLLPNEKGEINQAIVHIEPTSYHALLKKTRSLSEQAFC